MAKAGPASTNSRILVKEPAKRFSPSCPPKGAPAGATTIAVNLAYQWKRHGHKKILLADPDLLTGTTSFLLKIKSVYALLDALHHVYELDADSRGRAW